MKDDVGVRKLVEFIFVQVIGMAAEKTELDSSTPTCLLINDFPRKLHSVLATRSVVFSLKHGNEFHTLSSDMLTSNEKYLPCVMLACLKEHACFQNVFDSFIAMCSLVRYYSRETLQKTGVDFGDFNTHIVMEFYDSVLKKLFRRCGGFQQLIEYIHNHKYLTWNLKLKFLNIDGREYVALDVRSNKGVKVAKEIEKENNAEKSVKHNIAALDASSKSMAQRIFSKTSANSPVVQSDHDPKQIVESPGLDKKAITSDGKKGLEAALRLEPLEEVSLRCSNSNPDSKTNHTSKHKNDILQYENIIQAVKRCNNFKSSCVVNPDSSIQEKADSILEHLKDGIQSLIEVLDGYDKE